MRYIKLFCVSYYTYYDEVLLFWTLPEKLSPFLLFSSGSPVQTSHRLQTDPIGGNLLFENPLQHFTILAQDMAIISVAFIDNFPMAIDEL